MLSNKRAKPNCGFSLIETMVSMALLALIGAAIISLVLTVLALNNSAKLRNQAIGLAGEGVEQLRSFFSANGYSTLESMSNNKCYSNGSLETLISPCPSDPAVTTLTPPNCLQGVITSNPLFYRSVWLISSGGSVKVRSIVTWSDRGKCSYNEVDTYYYPF